MAPLLFINLDLALFIANKVVEKYGLFGATKPTGEARVWLSDNLKLLGWVLHLSNQYAISLLVRTFERTLLGNLTQVIRCLLRCDNLALQLDY